MKIIKICLIKLSNDIYLCFALNYVKVYRKAFTSKTEIFASPHFLFLQTILDEFRFTVICSNIPFGY